MNVRVLIVDDQPMIREGLTLMLRHADGIEPVASACDGLEALELIPQHPVDVAIVDIRMPRMDGPAFVAALRSVSPRVRCVMLTTFDDDDLLLASLNAGAQGYLLKDATPVEIADTIRRVHAGQTVLGSAPTEALIALAQAAKAVVREPAEELSARETEVLELLLAGHSNHEIANHLYLSTGSVKNYVTKVLRKYGAQTRAQLLARHTSLRSD